MRPGSEIHSAIELIEAELKADIARGSDNSSAENALSQVVWRRNMSIAHDVLSWVVGQKGFAELSNSWLAAFLLDEPEKIGDDVDPQVN